MSHETPSAAAPSRPHDAPLRILVVDDDELDRLAVRRSLNRSSTLVQVDEASSSAETLKRLGTGRYDCTLLDYFIPGVDGLSLLSAMRQVAPEMPVIVLTGRGDEEVAVELMKAGVADYLPKASLTPERLTSSIRHALELTEATVARRRAEEELRTQEARFRTLANAIPQLAWMADSTGQRYWYNQRWFEYTGFTPEEMMGFGWLKVHHPDHVQRVNDGIRRAFAEGVPWEDTFPLRGKDGAFRWFLSRALPITGEGGGVTGWLGTNTDITDNKRAEGLLRLLCDAAEHLLSATDLNEMMHGLFEKIRRPLGVDVYLNYMVDDGGLVLESYAGLSAEAAQDLQRLQLGASISGTAAARRQPIHATSIQQSSEPMTATARALGLRACSSHPLLAEYELLGALSFASKSKDAFLPDELDFLRTISHYVTAASERLRRIGQLHEADRRKDEFLATLAHELRGPLAPLRNMLEVIKQVQSADPHIIQARDTMDRQLGHLVQLVDDLLDVSRITRGKIELRRGRIELAPVVQQAVEAVRPLIDEAGHELNVALPSQPLYLDADPTRLAQVIGNLLTNACKYTESGGRIWLSIERQGSDAVISVKDTGIGIPPDKLATVFEMFSQIQSALERSQGGLGIGLTLVKRLVEMHGGTIEAASAGPGRGSEFKVRLPVLVDQPPAAAAEPQPTATAVAKRRVLIVDDNRDSAMSLAMLLKHAGNTTHQAHDGLEAIAAAEQFRPDIMLLDIGLPSLNGYEACQRIREQPWGRKLVIVALTGWGHDEDRRRSRDAGFDHHLVKPVNYADLIKLLNETVREVPLEAGSR